jgi:hypothetical protein
MTLILGDLRELKAVLEIDPGDLSEDRKLLFLIEQASQYIEEILNRDFSYKTRTQFYDGTGTRRLSLRNRPVYPNATSPISVSYDPNGFYGEGTGAFTSQTSTLETLTYGVDYVLRIDQDDGSSRSGILYGVNQLWKKQYFRSAGWLSPFIDYDSGSYKVVYTAGWTVDTLPATMRWAVNLLVAKMRYLLPVGMEIGGESYEERAISIISERKGYLTSLVKSAIMGSFRNWKF